MKHFLNELLQTGMIWANSYSESTINKWEQPRTLFQSLYCWLWTHICPNGNNSSVGKETPNFILRKKFLTHCNMEWEKFGLIHLITTWSKLAQVTLEYYFFKMINILILILLIKRDSSSFNVLIWIINILVLKY